MKIKVFFVNLLILAFGIIIIELFFGGWLGGKKLGGLNIMQNAVYQMDISGLYGKKDEYITYKRDSFGLRGSYPSPSDIDILTIGGSATDQRYLDEGKTWQDILAKLFKGSSDPKSVVNAGIDGQSTYGHIKNFELWFPSISNFKPKFVLVYVGVNDLFTQAGGANDDLAGNETIKGVIRSKSALYHFYKIVKGHYLGSYVFPLGHRPANFNNLTAEGLQTNYERLISSRLEDYKKRLNILIDKIISIGAKPIIVSQCSKFYKVIGVQALGVADQFNYEGRKVNGVDISQMLSLMNKETMAVCKGRKAICLDAAEEIDFEEGDFYDYFHNTPDGAFKIAVYLHNKLKGLI